MEYWIVCDGATGAELYRGSGSPGTSAFQTLPDGAFVVIVPLAVVAKPELDLTALRTFLSDTVDNQAELERQRFLTPGAGQAMTYQAKQAEARAWTADNNAPTPFLSAEAPARGMTIAALAAEVIQLVDVWIAIGSAIEGKRMGAKAAIGAAQVLGDIVTAAKVDWSSINATHV